IVEPATHAGTGFDSVSTLPLTAVIVPLPRSTSGVKVLYGVAVPLSRISSSLTFAPEPSSCRRYTVPGDPFRGDVFVELVSPNAVMLLPVRPNPLAPTE